MKRPCFANTRSELTLAQIEGGDYAYDYDPIGNREWSAVNGQTNTYTANALNQYSAITNGLSAAPSYDLDGNMTYLPSTSGGGAGGEGWLQWNGENRLVSHSNGTRVVSFVYDYMGRRAGKTVTEWDETAQAWVETSTSTYLYDGWNLIAETITLYGCIATPKWNTLDPHIQYCMMQSWLASVIFGIMPIGSLSNSVPNV